MICVKEVNVSPSSVTIFEGTWYDGATATVSPSNATCCSVRWSSDNPDVAAVNELSGYIYPVAPGTAKIYATATDGSGKSDYITVTVPEWRLGAVNVGEGSSLQLRAAPSESAEVVGEIAHDATVRLLRETPVNDVWYDVYILTNNGNYIYGWSKQDYLGYYVPGLQSKCNDNIRVRTSTNTSNNDNIIARITTKGRVRLIEENSIETSTHIWHKIWIDNQIAYVPAGENGEEFFIKGFILVPFINNGDYHNFLDKLSIDESSGNYSAVSGDHLGRYQLSTIALQDIGFKYSNGSWTPLANRYNITSDADFLASPQAQEIAIDLFHRNIWKLLIADDAWCYIGLKYQNVVITESGLLAAAHLVGASRIMQAIRSNSVVTDSNGTPAHSYMERMKGYDISKIQHLLKNTDV